MAEPTLRQYARGAAALIDGLGADPTSWKAVQVREFMLDRSRHCGAETTQKLITSLRAFLRYLRFRGLCSADLDQAVPAFAHWRLARMPRCLSAEEVKRLIAACKGSTPRRLRDRAIILMLVRLGLRAGDVSQLRLSDIDWQCGTLRVVGKGRHEVRLPLPKTPARRSFAIWSAGFLCSLRIVSLSDTLLLLSRSSRAMLCRTWSREPCDVPGSKRRRKVLTSFAIPRPQKCCGTEFPSTRSDWFCVIVVST